MKMLGFNDEHDATLKGFLLPTLSELIWLFAISFVLMVVLNYQAIWDVVISDSGASQQATKPLLESVSVFFAQPAFGKAAVFLFWGLVGCVSYAVIWSLQHFTSRIKNDVDGSEFVQPQTKQGYWSSRLSSYIFLVAITFTFIITLFIWFTALLPHAVRWASIPLQNLSDISGYKNSLIAIGITMVCIYVLSRLWSAVAYSFRLNFGQN